MRLDPNTLPWRPKPPLMIQQLRVSGVPMMLTICDVRGVRHESDIASHKNSTVKSSESLVVAAQGHQAG